MRIVAESGVHTTIFDDGALLAVSRNGKVFRANPTAAAMWTAIAESDGDPERAAVSIANHYGIPQERARSDLTSLVGRLHDAQLIRWQP
ncbi:PqqD family protein [Gandjariella thermophila]|nr:PqqD family protein [Gandjariella thermophila]